LASAKSVMALTAVLSSQVAFTGCFGPGRFGQSVAAVAAVQTTGDAGGLNEHLPYGVQGLASVVHAWAGLLLHWPPEPAHWVVALATVHACVFPG